MNLITPLLLLVVICVMLTDAEEVRSAQAIDYNKIFAGETWSTSETFLSWAKPITIKSSEKTQCSDRTIRSLNSPLENVLFCQQVATLESEERGEAAHLAWTLIRTNTPSPYGHDCNVGMVYLDKKQTIKEDAPADCEYSMGIEDRADSPIMVFQVRLTGEIGIVIDGHGAECGGRTVLKQEGNSLKRVHELYWTCEH